MQFLVNPINLTIQYNSMPTFHYKCVLLIIHNSSTDVGCLSNKFTVFKVIV